MNDRDPIQILLVEDNPGDVELTARASSNEPARTSTCRSPPTASRRIDFLRRERPSCEARRGPT